jgi:hypothetical protein
MPFTFHYAAASVRRAQRRNVVHVTPRHGAVDALRRRRLMMTTRNVVAVRCPSCFHFASFHTLIFVIYFSFAALRGAGAACRCALITLFHFRYFLLIFHFAAFSPLPPRHAAAAAAPRRYYLRAMPLMPRHAAYALSVCRHAIISMTCRRCRHFSRLLLASPIFLTSPADAFILRDAQSA